MRVPGRKDRFKPRADANLLSSVVQDAWKAYQDSFADDAETCRVAETIARHFENLIPASDFEVLKRYNCIAYHDCCNVRVYDPTEELAPYRQVFGITMPRKVPVLGTGGMGYPSLAACSPVWGFQPDDHRGVSAAAVEEMKAEGKWEKFKADQDKDERKRHIRGLDQFFASLLKMRKEYLAEYKASLDFPTEHRSATGEYPTWCEIEDRFPVLGRYMAGLRRPENGQPVMTLEDVITHGLPDEVLA